MNRQQPISMIRTGLIHHLDPMRQRMTQRTTDLVDPLPKVWRLLHYVTDTFELLVMVLIALGTTVLPVVDTENLVPRIPKIS